MVMVVAAEPGGAASAAGKRMAGLAMDAQIGAWQRLPPSPTFPVSLHTVWRCAVAPGVLRNLALRPGQPGYRRIVMTHRGSLTHWCQEWPVFLVNACDFVFQLMAR